MPKLESVGWRSCIKYPVSAASAFHARIGSGKSRFWAGGCIMASALIHRSVPTYAGHMHGASSEILSGTNGRRASRKGNVRPRTQMGFSQHNEANWRISINTCRFITLLAILVVDHTTAALAGLMLTHTRLVTSMRSSIESTASGMKSYFTFGFQRSKTTKILGGDVS